MRFSNVVLAVALAIGLAIPTATFAAQEELPAPQPTPAPAPKAAPAPARKPSTKAPTAAPSGRIAPAPIPFPIPGPGFIPRPGFVPVPPGVPPLPPVPRRLAAGDASRADRRERLRALGNQVFTALAAPDAESGAAPLLDISKLNAGLKPLVVEMLGGADYVESLRIGFDPQGTDFAADRLRLTADAVLRRTAWADAPSRANGTVNAQITTSDTGKPVAVVDGQLRIETSTVALANYAIAQYKAKRARQANETSVAPAPAPAAGPAPAPLPAPKDKNGADEILAQMLDEKFATIDRLESLDDVADLLTAVSGLRLTAVSQRIEQLREQARSAEDAETRRNFETQLAAVRADRDKLFDIRPAIERGPDGRARLISLGMVGSELFPGAEMREMEVRLLENEVSIAAAGALTRYVELYPLVKPVLMNVLVRIQNSDPRALDALRTIINGALGTR